MHFSSLATLALAAVVGAADNAVQYVLATATITQCASLEVLTRTVDIEVLGPTCIIKYPEISGGPIIVEVEAPECDCGCKTCINIIEYTTYFPAFCSTGLYEQKYLITETYKGMEAQPTIESQSIPFGFTCDVQTCTTCGPEPITATITYPVNGHPYINGGARPTLMPAKPGEISAESAEVVVEVSDEVVELVESVEVKSAVEAELVVRSELEVEVVVKSELDAELVVRSVELEVDSEVDSEVELVVKSELDGELVVMSVELEVESEVELVVNSEAESVVVLVVELVVKLEVKLEVELAGIEPVVEVEAKSEVELEDKLEVEPEAELVVVELVEIELDLELIVLMAAVSPVLELSVVVALEVGLSAKDWMLLMSSEVAFSVLVRMVVSVTTDVISDVIQV
ncbi:hypothetical protein FPRO05_03288 [Fusarium proliferatum]|uniref:Uncharacterized protein n=1 Tax=Gibberella intermedia TaxID=948311 RepID=A0A365N160_GIBIN|nr:hypothetical protein FPRO05_03288 [Fusarium proliferatum]